MSAKTRPICICKRKNNLYGRDNPDCRFPHTFSNENLLAQGHKTVWETMCVGERTEAGKKEGDDGGI